MTTSTERNSAEPDLRTIVADARQARGLTQEALAEQVQMSQEWVAKVEGGRIKSPRLATLRRLAEALRVDYDLLILAAGYAGSRKGAATVAEHVGPDPRLPAHLRTSFHKLEELTPERQRRVIEMIEEQVLLDELERERLRRDEE